MHGADFGVVAVGAVHADVQRVLEGEAGEVEGCGGGDGPFGDREVERGGGVQAYYPYGEERTSTSDNREKFGTYVRDSVGQDYADQRYYGTGTGRFWTADPGWRGAVNRGNPTSWNLYLYGLGDPVGLVDPRGLNADMCDEEEPWDCVDPEVDPEGEQIPMVGGGGGGDTPFVTSSIAYYSSCPADQTMVNSNGQCDRPIWGSNEGNGATIVGSVAAAAGPVVNGMAISTVASVPFVFGGAITLPLLSPTVVAAGTAAVGAGESPQGQQTIATIAAQASVFWSGPGAEAAANAYAAANSGVTLGMTAAGQAAAQANTWEAWTAASLQFAQQAAGMVQVFSNAPLTPFNSMWFTVELPALVNNPAVTNIVFNSVPGHP